MSLNDRNAFYREVRFVVVRVGGVGGFLKEGSPSFFNRRIRCHEIVRRRNCYLWTTPSSHSRSTALN